MRESKYLVLHGWVDDILKDPENPGGYRLRLKQDEGESVDLAVGQVGHPIKLGDEVSVAVERVRPFRVRALVDRTTGHGSNHLRGDVRRWPGGVDALIIAAAAGTFAVAQGWAAVPALVVFVLAYWLVTCRIPAVWREGAAARVDFLMDKEYCRWRASLDRAR